MSFVRLAAIAVFAVLLIPAVAMAQDAGDSPAADNRWQFTIAPYFLAPNMNGNVSVKGIDAEVDASPGDIFDRLQFGFMIYGEARKGDWAFSIDALYMDLAQNAERLPLEVGMQQGAYMFSLYRTVTPWADFYIGGRLNVLGGSLRGTGGPERIDVSEDVTWFDPYLGMRVVIPNTGRWHLGLRFDLGGFGIASDLAWHVNPVVAYRVSRVVRIAAAYRWLGMDYKAGDERTAFRYDVVTSGPELGIAFNF